MNRVSQLTCFTFWSALSFDSVTPQRFQRSAEPCDKSLQVDLETIFKEIFLGRQNFLFRLVFVFLILKAPSLLPKGHLFSDANVTIS